MRGKTTFFLIYEERGVDNIYIKKEKVEAVREAKRTGGDAKALTKEIKVLGREELEQEVLRLMSTFPHQPCA